METTTRRAFRTRFDLLAHGLVEQLRRGGENPLLSPPDPHDPGSQLNPHERERLLRGGRRSVDL